VNGWTGAPFGTAAPSVVITSGIVHFKGAIAGGTSAVAFTLPAAFRPSKNVFIPVDLCNATNGRLDISPSGVTSVVAEGGTFSNAQCFTSLDGAWFAKSASSFTALTLQNGWTNAPFGTSKAEIRNIGGVVHFKGAIATGGTNSVPFTLPAAFRPSTNVWVPLDLCDATNGRLVIQPNGVTSVEAEGGTFSNAQCFTSLDGASFAKSGQFFTKLTIINGWINAPFGTSNAAAAVVGGVVRLKGAVASGTSGVMFTLPAGFRPAKAAYAKVDLCGATNGRVFIQPNGTVTVQQQSGDPFSNAQCFTSLDGASFAP